MMTGPQAIHQVDVDRKVHIRIVFKIIPYMFFSLQLNSTIMKLQMKLHYLLIEIEFQQSRVTAILDRKETLEGNERNVRFCTMEGTWKTRPTPWPTKCSTTP